jgi:hypothetical protein
LSFREKVERELGSNLESKEWKRFVEKMKANWMCSEAPYSGLVF